MSTTDVIARLGDHGCEDMTNLLHHASFNSYPISSGGFGDVYRGTLTDGVQVAVKTMRIHVHSEEGQKPLKNAARELHTWSKCQHPNILKLLGLVEFRGQIGMVSRWMKNGSLPAYLDRFPDVNRSQISIEICEGLSYLHGETVVHGDLKGLNVLISDDGTPVLTDFGNAVLQQSTLQFTTTTQKFNISVRWAAPELIEGLGAYSFEADIYALGMTILEALTGNVPYYYKTDHGIAFAVVDRKELPRRPEDCIPTTSQHGDALWSLLTSCWAYEPEERPRVNHVLSVMKTITQEGLTTSSMDTTED
ncbi:kinase-like protein [Ceratobasidium sp. AG-I]|nr:kinase-like protein [Ceratobasidium sp. AG-I]